MRSYVRLRQQRLQTSLLIAGREPIRDVTEGDFFIFSGPPFYPVSRKSEARATDSISPGTEVKMPFDPLSQRPRTREPQSRNRDNNIFQMETRVAVVEIPKC